MTVAAFLLRVRCYAEHGHTPPCLICRGLCFLIYTMEIRMSTSWAC